MWDKRDSLYLLTHPLEDKCLAENAFSFFGCASLMLGGWIWDERHTLFANSPIGSLWSQSRPHTGDYTHVYMYVHDMCIYTCEYMYIHICLCIYVYMYIYMCIYIYAYMYMYMYMYMYIYIYIRTYSYI